MVTMPYAAEAVRRHWTCNDRSSSAMRSPDPQINISNAGSSARHWPYLAAGATILTPLAASTTGRELGPYLTISPVIGA